MVVSVKVTQEQADAKLATWLEKLEQLTLRKDGLTKAQADVKTKTFKAEQDVNAKRLAAAAKAEMLSQLLLLLLKKLLKLEASTEETPAEENNEETQA
jgi:small subunit ribosomal protein S16